MKTLVIVTHPNIEESRINKRWVQELQKNSQITVHQLYQAYPDEVIDAAKEQTLLKEHDRIIWQFPLYWYSSPSLLKNWFDTVFAYGFAFGPGGDKLQGKQFGAAISTFGAKEAYQSDGSNRYTIEELTRPFEAASNYVGAHYLPLFVLNDVSSLTDEELAQNAADYVKHVTTEHFVFA